MFALSFFGAALFLSLALAAHGLGREAPHLIVVTLACGLYIGGGFLLTLGVNVPMNEELALLSVDKASSAALASARDGYEGP